MFHSYEVPRYFKNRFNFPYKLNRQARVMLVTVWGAQYYRVSAACGTPSFRQQPRGMDRPPRFMPSPAIVSGARFRLLTQQRRGRGRSGGMALILILAAATLCVAVLLWGRLWPFAE